MIILLSYYYSLSCLPIWRAYNEYIAEEAIAIGFDTTIFITGWNKHAIENHFGGNNKLQFALYSKGKSEIVDMVKNILPNGIECIFVSKR